MMKRLDRTEIIFKIVSYALLTVFALACLYPLLFVLFSSISSYNAVEKVKFGYSLIHLILMLIDLYLSIQRLLKHSGYLIVIHYLSQCMVL